MAGSYLDYTVGHLSLVPCSGSSTTVHTNKDLWPVSCCLCPVGTQQKIHDLLQVVHNLLRAVTHILLLEFKVVA